MNVNEKSGEISKNKEVKSFRLCGSCRNHKLKVSLVGHKNRCPYEKCRCKLCTLSKKVKKTSSIERHFQREVDKRIKSKSSEKGVECFVKETPREPSLERESSLEQKGEFFEATTSDDHQKLTRSEPIAEVSEEWMDWESCINFEYFL